MPNHDNRLIGLDTYPIIHFDDEECNQIRELFANTHLIKIQEQSNEVNKRISRLFEASIMKHVKFSINPIEDISTFDPFKRGIRLFLMNQNFEIPYRVLSINSFNEVLNTVFNKIKEGMNNGKQQENAANFYRADCIRENYTSALRR